MNNYTKNSDDDGDIVISNEVIAAIALKAAKETEGVSEFLPRPSESRLLLKSGDELKYVKVSVDENEIVLNLYIKIKYNQKIPFVAAEIQKNVKVAVEEMTGKTVVKVNVSILDVELPDETK